MVYEAQGVLGTIEVEATFPAIREGDMPALVKAVVEALTLDNKGGQIVGIDEKTGVRKLLDLIGEEDPDEIVEEMYPESTYEPDRTKVLLSTPIGRVEPDPGGVPQLRGGQDPPPVDKKVATAQ